MAIQEVALRKRQQITNANRLMFLWVAGTSVIVGMALVSSIFLFQKATFNEKVLSEKGKTASILTKNNKVVDELKNQIRVLNTNENLKKIMAPGETQPVQVVLDALPADANSSAFGASLQKKFLNSDGLTLEALGVDPVAGIESLTEANATVASTEPGKSQIVFRFTVSADITNANALKKIQQDLERSVRPIDVTTASVEAQGKRLVLKVEGHTYYEQAKSITLKDKTVKP